jgi:hypothetical protein
MIYNVLTKHFLIKNCLIIIYEACTLIINTVNQYIGFLVGLQ